ncbi:Uncharacterised protein [uncultured Oscillibacter sp.]|jgi:hypothetical protein|uniref:hypothetical protein n=1 Tax=uncultured Oscillibacter sp. TaxID=876091 RepID=UPI0008235566|nr:hypothetical protein [uncultured Oscillibacter sp.]SCI19589.1 Uncharacterised protein [uncultured Oscillibacter sp.]
MRAIDSDALKEYIKKTDLTAVERGALLQAISNMPTLTPPNEPLTLKELREMDDEPVWCCPKNDSAKGSWMIVGPNGCENITSFAIYDDYGTGWLAYRRPPEVSP